MKVAIEGCCHGELDKIYATIEHLQEVEGVTVDLLLICGDFQSIRNEADMDCLSCPPKYRQLGTFWEYYTGLKTAPIPTIFIGGNHEASNYLTELYHGGWVCKNIYYLGAAGVINFGGLRIGGLSGIYKREDFFKGHHEAPPYTAQDLRSVYHVRRYDIEKLLQIKQPLDIFLSHDWPRGIEQHGDVHSLLRRKPFFRDEVRTNTLGSPANEDILNTIMPRYWFSAHLHVKFAALVRHRSSIGHELPPASRSTRSSSHDAQPHVQLPQNPDEIMLDEELSPTETKNPDEIILDVELDGLQTKNPDEITLDELDLLECKNPDEIILEEEINTMEVGNPEEIMLDEAFDEPEASAGHTDILSHGSTVDDAHSHTSSVEGGHLSKISATNLASDNDVNSKNEQDKPSEIRVMTNPDEINLDDSDAEADSVPQLQSNAIPSDAPLKNHSILSDDQPPTTKFLALDKCLPRRDFLQVVDIPSDPNVPKEFRYDAEWLAITKSTQEYLTLSRYQTPMPDRHTLSQSVAKNFSWIQENLNSTALKIPDNFEVIAPPFSPMKSLALHSAERVDLQRVFNNPQTETFCNLIQIENKIAKLS
ncbi:lariat debranching enzyme, partial [Basidiobolus ranarum]